jgi:GNAT superfamily N-acetyltransferase
MNPTSSIQIRPVTPEDFNAWLPLWNGYNAFYGRSNETALNPEITQMTWQRFFDANEPVYALVAECEGKLVGLTHYLYHRSTTKIEPVCYLQDLFTEPSMRGHGVGRVLIQAVKEVTLAAGIKRVYWQTHQSNSAGRLLYDKVAKHAGFIVYGYE